MSNLSEYPTATLESVWAAFRENDKQREEEWRFFKEQIAANERRVEEDKRALQEQIASNKRRVEADKRALKAKIAANDRLIQKSKDEFDRQMKESREDYDRQMKESREDYDRRMKNFEKTMGAWSNNHGSFAEEYFYNSFENGKNNFFGEKFDRLEKNAKGFKENFVDEYDILLINGKSIGIVEVKFKGHEGQIPKILKKAETFRENFPYYANHQVYLGLASMTFTPELEKACIRQGIAVVKQVGDTVVINDANLKVF